MSERRQEWGVRHPDGTVTVGFDGHGFLNRFWAESEAAKFDKNCQECDGGKHVSVWREIAEWMASP